MPHKAVYSQPFEQIGWPKYTMNILAAHLNTSRATEKVPYLWRKNEALFETRMTPILLSEKSVLKSLVWSLLYRLAQEKENLVDTHFTSF